MPASTGIGRTKEGAARQGKRPRMRRLVGLAASGALLATGLLGVAPSAQATDPCAQYSGSGYTATDVGNRICEIVFAYTGSDDTTGYTWTIPQGPTGFDFLLVGGGGGGGGGKYVQHGSDPNLNEIYGGGGGGGGVVALLRLPAAQLQGLSTLDIYVGRGGAGGAAGQSGNSGFGTGFAAIGIAANGGDAGSTWTSGRNAAGGGSGYSVNDQSVNPPVTEGATYAGGTGPNTGFTGGFTGIAFPGGGGAGAGMTSATNAGGSSIVCAGGTKNVNAAYTANLDFSGYGGNGYRPNTGLFAGVTEYYGGGGAGGPGESSCVAYGGLGQSGNDGRGGAGSTPGFPGTAGFGGGGGGGAAGISGGLVQSAGGAGGSGVAKVRFTRPVLRRPFAPTGLVATPGNGSASIAFTAGNNGGAPITNYEYSTDEGNTWTALSPAVTTSPVTIPGLTNGTQFTIYLRAVNSVGEGDDSGPVQVTPSGGGGPTPDPVFPPSAPRDVTALPGDRSALVSWREPASAGSFPVSTYKAIASPGGASCLTVAPSLTCTVAGLTNGTAYTFSVEGLNGAGWSPAGGPSAPVTPGGVTPAPQPVPIPTPLAPGDSLLQTNGAADPNVTVDANTSTNGLVISGDGWRMDLDGLGPDGKPLSLGPDGSLRLANERDVATEGSGFLPNSEVDLYVDPPVQATGASTRTGTRAEAGIYVGTVRTDASGNFSGTATLPEDITPGDHVLQAVGYSPTRQSRAMSLGVVVEQWIVLDKGSRKPAGVHDRMRTTGASGGIDAGTKLTPHIRYAGQSSFSTGVATITVKADGSFTWSRLIRKDRGLTAYVSYLDTESNRVVWARVR